MSKEFKLIAHPVKQGGSVFYQSSVRAGDLVDETYWRIDRWDPATGEGYQREINQSHSHRLARYLGRSYLEVEESSNSPKSQSLTNVLPSSIVVNFRTPLDVTKLPDGAVEIVLNNFPGYIIDGQHRIEGARETLEKQEGTDALVDYEFPVTITNFTIEEEMVHFRNLNSTANRPPKGLNEAIAYSLSEKYGRTPFTWGEVAANRATGITMRLASDTDSPWYGRIALGGIRKRGMHSVVQAQFSDSMRPMFVSGRFSDPAEQTEHTYELIKSFWVAVEKVWPDAINSPETSTIQRAAGFKSLNKLLERIFNNVKLNPTEEDFVALLQSIRSNAGINGQSWNRSTGQIDQLRLGYSSAKGIKIVTEYLWSAIDADTKEKIGKVK